MNKGPSSQLRLLRIQLEIVEIHMAPGSARLLVHHSNRDLASLMRAKIDHAPTQPAPPPGTGPQPDVDLRPLYDDDFGA